MGSAQSISCATLTASCVEGSVGSALSTSLAMSSASCAGKSGKCDVNPELTGVRNEIVNVLDIGYYRVRINEGRSIILHDFLGLRVRFRDGIECNIRAEKFKHPAGISVTRPIKLFRDTDDVQIKHRAEELEDCGDILMEDLLAILTEPSPNYNLMCNNCWKYADATFKQVIRKFLETPSLTRDRRRYLERFLNNPPPPMPNDLIISYCFKFVQGLMLLSFWRAAKAVVVEGAILCSMFPPTLWFWLVLYICIGVYFFLFTYEIVAFVKFATSAAKDITEWWRSSRFKRLFLRLFRFRRPLLQQAHGLPLM